MARKPGLRPVERNGLGLVVSDWYQFNSLARRNNTGKAAGKRYSPMVPGVGLVADVVAATDVYKNCAGLEYVFKDYARGARFVTNGTYLHPLGGSACVAQRAGSIAHPAVSLTLAAAAGAYTLPEAIYTPANLLIPGQGQLMIEAVVRHTTGTSLANFNIYYGTAGNTGDSRVGRVTFTGVASEILTISVTINLDSTGANVNAVQGTTSSDLATNINNASNMYATLQINGSTSGDVFDILSYRSTIRQ